MNLKRSLLLIFILASVNAFSQKEDYVKFGGALRFNVFNKSWIDNATQPEATLDTWRLNVDARTAGVDLSFEYRFYPTSGNSHFLHHGYLGYGFTDDLYMKLGVSQVPFGITKYASHSWWFQIPYYVGLEDDYDMGIKFDYTGIENLKFSVAYFRQPEFNGGASAGLDANASRYSYDITPKNPADATTKADSVSIQELNQFNIRAAYDITENIEVGFSGQLGGIYNSVLGKSEMSTAFAGHVVANFGGFNFKGEYIYYNYSAKNDADKLVDEVQMGAYAYNYNVAAEASMVVAGLAYSIPVEWGPISNLQPYVDYSVINKAAAGFEPTQHLVPGMLITAGSIYTYVDYAMGQNNAWLGPFSTTWNDGLAAGQADAEWHKRFNINIGYYF
jgi:hypothetical protein